jgi:long-chain fatty acid transport protein
LAAVPQLFYSYGMTNLPVALGLGVYSPYGLSSEWAEDTGFRSVAIKGSMNYWTFNPVVAWRVLPTLSVAAGPTINYAKTELEQGLSPVPNNDRFRFEGDGTDVGFSGGILWRPHSKVSLGASYRSATKVDLSGHTDTVVVNALPGLPSMALRLDAQAAFQFPQNAVVGVSFRPTPDWNIEFDADYTDWNQLNSLAIHQTGGPSVQSVFNWKSSWYYELGVTRYLGQRWSVSVGYIYNENSVPDATYTPLVADLNRHFASAGLGYAGKTVQFDLAYQFGYGPTREVVGSAMSGAGQTADGRYSFVSHALLATLGFRF